MQLICTAANSIKTPFYLPRFLCLPEVNTGMTVTVLPGHRTDDRDLVKHADDP